VPAIAICSGRGPKRILSLDGGGVRGAISVAFLEQIEKILTENLTKKVRLGNYFDLVGGTSTSRSSSKGFAGATKSTRLPSLWLKFSQSISVRLGKLRALLVRLRNPDRT